MTNSSKEKGYIKFRLNITWSKIMSFLILLVASICAYKTKESSVAIIGMTISAGLLGWRQQKTKEIKKIESETIPDNIATKIVGFKQDKK